MDRSCCAVWNQQTTAGRTAPGSLPAAYLALASRSAVPQHPVPLLSWLTMIFSATSTPLAWSTARSTCSIQIEGKEVGECVRVCGPDCAAGQSRNVAAEWGTRMLYAQPFTWKVSGHHCLPQGPPPASQQALQLPSPTPLPLATFPQYSPACKHACFCSLIPRHPRPTAPVSPTSTPIHLPPPAHLAEAAAPQHPDHLVAVAHMVTHLLNRGGWVGGWVIWRIGKTRWQPRREAGTRQMAIR